MLKKLTPKQREAILARFPNADPKALDDFLSKLQAATYPGACVEMDEASHTANWNGHTARAISRAVCVMAFGEEYVTP
jgi:hypothetical protein